MEQEKNTVLMKDNEKTTSHSFFYRKNFKRTMRFAGRKHENNQR